jgi:hypothetical protein
MAVIPRLMILIGAIAFLGACSDEQVTPLQERSTYSDDPAIVRKVQVALRERGYYAGVVDGFLGQDTSTGIERFQVDHDQAVVPRIDRSLLVSLGIRSNR